MVFVLLPVPAGHVLGGQTDRCDLSETLVDAEGLEGFADGAGSVRPAEWHGAQRWLVLELASENVTPLDGRVRLRGAARVHQAGDAAAASAWLRSRGYRRVIGSRVSVGDFGGADGGDFSDLVGGVMSQLSAGDHSCVCGGPLASVTAEVAGTLRVGEGGTATAGEDCRVYGAESCRLSAEAGSLVIGADFAQVIVRNRCTVVVGSHSQVLAQDHCDITAGAWSQVSGWDRCRLSAGRLSIVSGRRDCQVAGGPGSLLSLQDHAYALHTARVGDPGILADCFYRLVGTVFYPVGPAVALDGGWTGGMPVGVTGPVEPV